MAKQLKYADEARRAIKAGADKVADAVKATLGPRGRQVLLDRKSGSPVVTIDGVTVAREIDLPDPFENLGAQLVREASSRTNDVAGDGTTTAVVLAQGIIHEGFRNLTAGADPLHIKRGIEKAVGAAVQELQRTARRVDMGAGEKARREITQIATVAAGDPGIGKLVADAVMKVGKDGAITVEEGRSAETTVEVVEGLQFDRGYVSPYFVTDAERMEAALEDAYLIITDKKISVLDEIMPLLEEIAKQGRPFVLLADDVEGEALATLVVNKLRGRLRCAAVKAPGFGDGRKEALEDIAALTGGQVITEEKGLSLEKAALSSLGRCKRVVVGKDKTTLAGGAGSEKAVKARIAQARKRLAETPPGYEREKLEERLAKLSGGVAVVHVGGATETAMKALKFKVEDAMHATRAGLEEGIVAGGGVALLRAQSALDGLQAGDEDERTGIRIVRRVLEEPLRVIAGNAGADGAIVADKVRNAEDPAFGYDAETGTYGDLLAAGIVDPVKVTRTALQNAASVACLLLITDVLVAEAPAQKAGAVASAVPEEEF